MNLRLEGENRGVPMNEVLTATLEEVRIRRVTLGPVFRSRASIPYRSSSRIRNVVKTLNNMLL